MRGRKLVSAALVLLVVSGCSQPEAQPEVSRPAPQTWPERELRVDELRVQALAMDAFGSSPVAVGPEHLVESDHESWRITVVLDGEIDWDEIDMCAATTLAGVASIDESDTSIALSVVSRELAWGESTGWGALTYYWGQWDGEVETRGGTVLLAHGGAPDPFEPPCDCFYDADIRGEWTGATQEALEEWGMNGTPEPVEPDSDSESG